MTAFEEFCSDYTEFNWSEELLEKLFEISLEITKTKFAAYAQYKAEGLRGKELKAAVKASWAHLRAEWDELLAQSHDV